ncbi:MAG: exonuclease domain-containing protein [Clostridia bacterium]|nr:exonuclease domain-containing protein [Clostridia bacterium]
MEYIVLDNEWHTPYCKINGKCINELIEIGAVKLDENLNEISRFSVLIKSTFTKKLNTRFQRLTNITTEEMLRDGMTFEQAVNLYSEWAGDSAITMTWSNSDLYVLLENFRLRRKINTVPIISKYIDLQKYVQNEMIAMGRKITSQVSVANAAIMLGLSIDGIGLHRALDDSLLCAEMLRKVYDKKRLLSYMIDTSSPDYYARLTFKAYIIRDLNNPLVNKKKMEFKCEKCGADAKRVMPWAFKGHYFKSEFVCPKCQHKFIGRVAFKKYYDKVVVKHNTVPITVEQTTNAKKSSDE